MHIIISSIFIWKRRNAANVKRFLLKIDQLKNHVNAIHENINCSCESCLKTFTLSDHLTIHIWRFMKNREITNVTFVIYLQAFSTDLNAIRWLRNHFILTITSPNDIWAIAKYCANTRFNSYYFGIRIIKLSLKKKK